MIGVLVNTDMGWLRRGSVAPDSGRRGGDSQGLPSTLPLRGRVGAQLRGGVTLGATSAYVTPTRACRATSPLKGEVEGCLA